MTQSFQHRLAQTLSTLRRRARLSQRDLAARSDISHTMVSELERAKGYNASPLTLRRLSRGLATYETDRGGVEVIEVDQTKADANYRQLMDAAGYLGGLPIDAPRVETSDRDVLEFLTSKAGDRDLAARLLGLARRYPDMSPEEQTAVRHLVRMLAKDH